MTTFVLILLIFWNLVSATATVLLFANQESWVDELKTTRQDLADAKNELDALRQDFDDLDEEVEILIQPKAGEI